MQLATGLWMVHTLSLPLSLYWLSMALFLYGLVGACWLPVLWLQKRARDLALQADATGQPPDDSCCDVAPTPGCGNAETQACVCTIEEGCCTQVWSQTCVDLAIECNDPACGEPPPATTTGMPPGDSSGEPTQTCDELAAMSGWAYHRCQNGDSQCHSMGTPTTDCDFCCEFCGEAGDVSCGDHATANNWPPGSALCEWNGNGACGGQGYAGTCDCDFCCQI